MRDHNEKTESMKTQFEEIAAAEAKDKTEDKQP